jgi:hypothetical protein
MTFLTASDDAHEVVARTVRSGEVSFNLFRGVLNYIAEAGASRDNATDVS